MIYSALLNEEGRILCTTYQPVLRNEEFVDIDFPEDFNFNNPSDYVYKDGAVVYDGKMSQDDELLEAEYQRAKQIEELKQKLADTDYVVIEISEATVSGITLTDDDSERYADIIRQRIQWRQQINELESQ